MKFLTSARISNGYKMHFPKEICDKLEIKEGDKIIFYDNKGEIIVKKA